METTTKVIVLLIYQEPAAMKPAETGPNCSALHQMLTHHGRVGSPARGGEAQHHDILACPLTRV